MVMSGTDRRGRAYGRAGASGVTVRTGVSAYGRGRTGGRASYGRAGVGVGQGRCWLLLVGLVVCC